MSLRADFLRFDDRLASHGVPRLTAWWREGIGAWLDAYEAGGALELWACVGRGAAKSTALYKLAVFFALFGDFAVPPGERHSAIVLSRLKEEAAKGLAIIARWLVLLGVAHKVAGDVIELSDLPRGIRVVAASVAGTSGWRAFFVGKDERSKWPMGGVEDLDGAEIDTSAAAMTATHERAPVVSVGSAWVAFGPFYEAVHAGTDLHRVVLGPAPTWVAAPHISKESTLRKERDPKRHAREYGSVFQASASSAFEAEDVDAAFAHPRQAGEFGETFGVLDPASGGKDSFTYGTVRWIRPPNGATWRPYVELSYASAISPATFRDEGADAVIAKIAAALSSRGVSRVFGDQREAAYIAAGLRKHRLRYTALDWTSTSKPPAVERVRGWLLERSLALPKDPPKLRTELLSFEERLSPSGQFTFAARGNGHDDYVALLVTSAMAELAGDFVAQRASAFRRRPTEQDPMFNTTSSRWSGMGRGF